MNELTTVYFIVMLVSVYLQASMRKTPVCNIQLLYLHGFTETCRREHVTVEQLQHVALDCAHRKLYSSLPKANIC
jgi:hypothetical protein